MIISNLPRAGEDISDKMTTIEYVDADGTIKKTKLPSDVVYQDDSGNFQVNSDGTVNINGIRTKLIDLKDPSRNETLRLYAVPTGGFILATVNGETITNAITISSDGKTDITGNADTLDGKHSSAFVEIDPLSRIYIPEESDIPAYISTQNKYYTQFYSIGTNYINLPNTSATWIWYFNSPAGLFCLDYATGKVFICNVVNGHFSGWRNIADGGAAVSATNDSSNQKINSTYIKSLSVSGRTITYTKGDGTTGTINTQDTNTTYGLATTVASGLVSTGSQTFAGNKTFTGNVTAASFIGTATNATNAATAASVSSATGKARLWEDTEGGNLRLTSPDGIKFIEMDCHDNANMRIYSSNNGALSFPLSYSFTTNKFTIVGDITGNAATATNAVKDSVGQQINSTYIKSLSVNGKVITYTKGDGTTGTITTQDTNTTYANATATTAGLMSTGAQTFAGNKTFNGAVSFASTISVAQSMYANGASDLATAQVRNISAGTTDLVAGTSALATGRIYTMYE